tara:strand:- start:1312 stop:2757 length:1446 start_codon:yes stop_codon:yes gene_type:complete
MKKKIKKKKPDLPSGFKDTNSDELILRDSLIEIIKKNFQLYGFEQISTSSFEFLDNVVDSNNDGEGFPVNDIFFFNNLGENESVKSKNENSTIALRPDLTKSLARYCAKNYINLSKPFKRFQVGTVWRDEVKPNTKGRFREFIQIDSDIVGTKNLNADADMVILLADTLQKCRLNKEDYVVKLSNRKLVLGLLNSLNIYDNDKRLAVIRTCDKFFRLGKSSIIELLKDSNLNEKQIKKILEFLESKSFEDVKKISKDSLFIEGIKELEDIIRIINLSSYSDRIIFSSSLMRGNEYYTSTIFEANLITKTKKGEKIELEYSVGGGGRYDRLVEKYTEDSYPGVGISIGLSRILFYISQLKEKPKLENKSPIVICVFDNNLMPNYKKILDVLRSANINSEIYYGDGNIKSQMKYADWRNSPAVLLYGENEAKLGTVTIKNLNAGKKSSEKIKVRKDWKSNESAQSTVKLENLLDEIKKIIKNN